MTAYYLRDDGYPTFKKIIAGKKWVGRVCRHADGDYVGTIGNDSVRAPTEVSAFEEVSARAMGYSSADELKAKNAVARRAKRVANAAADHVYAELLRGNYKPLDAVHNGRPVGLLLALRGATRDFRKTR